MKWVLFVTFGLPLLVAIGFSAFVRLAPLDPARWHVPLANSPRSIKPNDARVAPEGGDIAAPVFALSPTDLARRVEGIALAEPRTRLLAGGAESGRMTFVQRSRVWGFPDIITVETLAAPEGGSTLRIWSRARFGYSDFGVNRERVERWLRALART